MTNPTLSSLVFGSSMSMNGGGNYWKFRLPMYSYGPPHMAKQKQDDQLEHTYSSYVRIRDVALKTCQKRWMLGRSGERESEISVLAERLDDDDDDEYEQGFQLLVINIQLLIFSTGCSRRLVRWVCRMITYIDWGEKWKVYAFPKGISTKYIFTTVTIRTGCDKGGFF